MALVAVGVAGGVASLGFGAWRAPTDYGVALCVARAAHPLAPGSFDETLFAAAALSLTEEDRTQLESVVGAANTRWEGRANPLLEDFGEGDPDNELEDWLSHAPASVLTAFAASSPRFCALDGFCVEAVMPSAPCSSGFDRPRAKADRERARFLAWPFGHALWLRAETAHDAELAADALRHRARESRWIGLVLHASDGQRVEQDPFAELRERFVRHEVLKRVAIEKDAGADDGANHFPLHLDPREILVFPRVQALTSLAAFEEELRASAPSLRIMR